MQEGIAFGAYRLLGRLNSGGMAEVFLATSTDASAERLLAVKRMLPRLSSEPDFVSMFDDEARIASSLSHPNICKIVDQGKVDRQLYIAMEFIHGKDLRVIHRRARQRKKSIPWRHIAFVGSRIARALHYAHAKTDAGGQPQSIVHRDVSPQNVLISYDGVPKLIDFGIAKARDRIAQTRVGVVKGKCGYMSPEQVAGGSVDGRTDLFALGVVLYELLAGAPPFRGSSDLSTLRKIARADFPPIEKVRDDIPRRLVAVVHQALMRDARQRYQTGAEMAIDLDRYLADEPREVTESVISSFMRRLFRNDYIREMARMKEFLAAGENHRATPIDVPVAPGADVEQARAAEPTRVEPQDERTLSLAAGYDGAELEDAPAEPTQEEEVEKTIRLSPDDLADRPNAYEVSPRRSTEPFDEETIEAAVPSEYAEAAGRLDTQSVEPAPEDAVEATDNDIHDARDEAPLSWSDEPGTHEMDGKEIQSLVEASSRPVTGSAPLEIRSSDFEFDSDSLEITINGGGATLDDDFHIDEIDSDEDESTAEERVGAEDDLLGGVDDSPDERAASLEDAGSDRAPAPSRVPEPGSQPRAEARATPAPVKQRLLTDMEIAVLVLVAALGVALVIGTYWYAATAPLDVDRLQASSPSESEPQ